jgi:hypothetical protein
VNTFDRKLEVTDFSYLIQRASLFICLWVFLDSCLDPPPVQYASVSIPKVSSLPLAGESDENDIVYYTVDNKLYIYKSGVWTLSQLYGP